MNLARRLQPEEGAAIEKIKWYDPFNCAARRVLLKPLWKIRKCMIERKNHFQYQSSRDNPSTLSNSRTLWVTNLALLARAVPAIKTS
jgi:hypothetical protein